MMSYAPLGARTTGPWTSERWRERSADLTAPNYHNVTVTYIPPAGKYCTAGYIELRTSGGMFQQVGNDADGNKS